MNDHRTSTGWRPIRTAPKDGTIIILTTGTHTGVGRWRQVASRDTLDDYDDGLGMRAAFAPVFGWHSVSDKSLNKTPPTHWMPLPEPPECSARDSDGSGEAGQTPKGAGPKATARAEGIAQAQPPESTQHNPTGSTP